MSPFLPLTADLSEPVRTHFKLLAQSVEQVAGDLFILIVVDLARNFVSQFSLMAVAHKLVTFFFTLQAAKRLRIKPSPKQSEIADMPMDFSPRKPDSLLGLDHHGDNLRGTLSVHLPDTQHGVGLGKSHQQLADISHELCVRYTQLSEESIFRQT
jgi:hypothetical protein